MTGLKMLNKVDYVHMMLIAIMVIYIMVLIQQLVLQFVYSLIIKDVLKIYQKVMILKIYVVDMN